MASTVENDVTARPGDGPLLFARAIDQTGRTCELDWDTVRAWEPKNDGDVMWVHLDRDVDGVDGWLRDGLKLSEATVDALTSNENRPRAFREGNALATILRGVDQNPGANPEDLVSMQIWADPTRVITLRRRRLQAPFDVLAMLEAATEPYTAGDLVTKLVEQMVDRLSRSILDMNDRIDELENAGDDIPVETVLTAIADIRRKCLALKRYMSPQHEALLRIGRDAPGWLSESNRLAIRETIDQLHRYIEDIDVSKESALVLQDDINNKAAAQTNKTSYLLSIVAAIFLPLGFLTGLFGMNLGGMPGANSHQAFWIACACMTGIIVAQLAIFKRLKWL